MNILDAAYRIGQQMKTIPIGREWLELYKQLSQSISPEAWDTFIKMPTSKGFIHYYSFVNNMNIIEGNSTNDDLPEVLQLHLKELKASQTLKQFTELSLTLGRNLEDVIMKSLLPNTIPRDFGELRASPKLSRTIQDLHRAIQRSGVFKSMLRNKDLLTNSIPNIYNTFIQEKSAISNEFSPRIRRLIRNIGVNHDQQQFLTEMYMLEWIIEITRQMVFESHLERVANIPSDSIVKSVVKDVNGICPIYLKVDATMLSLINSPGIFMTVWLTGTSYTALLTRRKLNFGKNVTSGFKMTMNGYLYPESDMNLFK